LKSPTACERSARAHPARFERRRAIPQSRAGRCDVVDEHNLPTLERGCVKASVAAARLEPSGAAAPALRVRAGTPQDRRAREAAAPPDLAGEEDAGIVPAMKPPGGGRRDGDEERLGLHDRAGAVRQPPREREPDRPAAVFEGEDRGTQSPGICPEREPGEAAGLERDPRTLQGKAALAEPCARRIAPGAARRIERIEAAFEDREGHLARPIATERRSASREARRYGCAKSGAIGSTAASPA
jgi:hypothetical protein